MVATIIYTNINTVHRIEIIEKWLDLYIHELLKDFPKQTVINNLYTIMNYNVLQFGDRFFFKINGTVIETLCACLYTTIYYNYFEKIQFISRYTIYRYYKPLFYDRLINDAIVVLPDTLLVYNNFLKTINRFGPVEKRLE